MEAGRDILRASVLDMLSLKLLKKPKGQNPVKNEGKEVWGC